MNKSAMAILAAAVLAADPAAAQQAGFSAGAKYWQTVDDVTGSIDESGVSIGLAYTTPLNSFLSLQPELNLIPNNFGGSKEEVFMPQLSLLAGSSFFAGGSIGWLIDSVGDTADQPFFAIRAGIEIAATDTMYLDLVVEYQFSEWDGITRREAEDQGASDVWMAGLFLKF